MGANCQVLLLDQCVLLISIKDIYRRLRTNIEFTGIENKVIAVTSCESGDGKSTISYNLAKIFAENDKKVLFIDADM